MGQGEMLSLMLRVVKAEARTIHVVWNDAVAVALAAPDVHSSQSRTRCFQ